MNTSLLIRAGLATFSLAALTMGSAQASPVNLLADGNFENFAPMVASGGYTTVNHGSSLGAWTVGAQSVDLIRNAFGSINDVSIDLSGTPGPGSLSQTFMAQQGSTYTLSFDFFRNGAGTDMGVSFGGQDFVYTPGASATSASLVWTAESSGLQTITFTGGNGNQGPTLDNVMLTAAVPEPSSIALMLAGLGAMGIAARRRKG